MALVKCRECGEKVSSNAKTCPHCGVKAPGGTSLFKEIVSYFAAIVGAYVLFIFFYGIASVDSPSTSSLTSSAGSSKTRTTSTTSPVPAKAPEWTIITSTDEMTGTTSVYAASPEVSPISPMGLPYQDVRSWIAIGCNSENEWAVAYFSTAPNLVKDKTKDGYIRLSARIRWDDVAEWAILTQDWGSKFLHFQNSERTIQKISSANEIVLEIPWYGEGSTKWVYTLDGSSSALADIRKQCAAGT